ncbi:MAG: sugar transferase [Gemmatimonadales bacterium]
MTDGGWYRAGGKRALDLALTLPALVLLTPLIGLVALAVRVSMGRPILFRQARPGRHGLPFVMLKFRTMQSLDAHAPSGAHDRDRLTRRGRWLRSSSLDELPELWNVLRGEMSLVGPRPLLMEYLPLYSPEQARRHEVRPGMTGWAQVHGRNAVPWPERLALDVWYVDHCTLGLDLRILWRTAGMVLRRRGIAAPGEVTMAPFTGPGEPQ